MLQVSKWFGLGAILFVTFPQIAATQGTNTFDGTYVGVSASRGPRAQWSTP